MRLSSRPAQRRGGTARSAVGGALAKTPAPSPEDLAERPQAPSTMLRMVPPPPLRFTARGRISNIVLATPMRPSFASPQRHEKIRPRPTHDPQKWCPVFGQDHAQRRGRRSAERRMPTIAAQHQQTLPLVDVSARLRAKSGRARLPALRRGSRRDSHPCSAPGHASWDVDSARSEDRAAKTGGRYPPSPVPVQ